MAVRFYAARRFADVLQGQELTGYTASDIQRLMAQGLAYAAVEVGGTGTDLTSTEIGRAVLAAANAAEARAAIGAGTSNLALGTSSTTAKAGNYQPTAANISDASTVGRSVVTATDAAAARTAIGAGTSSLALGTSSSTAKAGDYTPPDASTTTKGIQQFAGDAEVDALTVTNKAISPATLKRWTDKLVRYVNGQLVAADGTVINTGGGGGGTTTSPGTITATMGATI